MSDLSPEEVEERTFRARLQRSHSASLAVANYLQRQGWQTEVPPVVIRPHFSQRKAYGDKGDLFIWKGANPKLTVEVKWRNVDFTSAETFPYPMVNVDRVNKPQLAFMYVSTNSSLTHALIIRASSKHAWRIELSSDPKRGYTPFEVYRCSLEHIEFVCLTPPPPSSEKRFYGHCHCGLPGLYIAYGQWACDQHRQI